MGGVLCYNKHMRYIMRIELDLPADDEGLTAEGWETYTKLQSAIETLRNDYGWTVIGTIKNPIQAEK